MELAEGPVGHAVVGGGPAHLRRQRLLPRSLEALCVLPVDRRPDLAQKAQEALPGLALERLELVAEDGREPDSHGRLLEDPQQREVYGRYGLPEPLLAERPRAEALHVRHVRVQHERQLAAVAHRRIARKSRARSRLPDRSAKSRSEMAGTKRP